MCLCVCVGPPKKTFGSTDRQFLVERQQGLQAYLDAILREPPLASTVEMKRFLDPHNYSVNFYGKSLQTFGVTLVSTTGACGVASHSGRKR